MKNRSLLIFGAALAIALVLPAGSAAQPHHSLVFSALGGFGGSNDADFGNSSFQLGFSFATDVKSLLGFRVGQVDMGGSQLGSLSNPDLTYATVAGEYRFTESYYESGLFIGLGLYELSGTNLLGGGDSSGLGLTVGATADFTINHRMSFLLELAGHYTDLDHENLFLTGHGGLGFHF